MAMRLVLGLLLGLLLRQAVAKKDDGSGPSIETYQFNGPPTNILWFEDSDVILAFVADDQTTYRSDDAGATWESLDGVKEGASIEVLIHPYDKSTAIVLGSSLTHWITRDRGKKWTSFETTAMPSRSRPGIVFHAVDPNRMIFQAEECQTFCEESVYYTTDGFETDPKQLGQDRDALVTCLWAQTSDLFTTGDDKLDLDQILCIAKGKWDFVSTNDRVLISSDYFATKPHEPRMSDGRSVQGVLNLATVKRYIVFASRSERTSELALYVTDDTITWHRAEFGEHRLEEDAYTLLESTNYSMQVDVMTTSQYAPMGVLLTSNSNGTFFTRNIEHTNRNMHGIVDFEQISHIQGVILVNTVENWKDVEKKWVTEREITSSVSFDDGHTWENLVTDDDKRLHLHSVTQQHNMGRIFSSPAPGMVMGIGNTGKYLRDYSEGDVYLSENAGLDWTRALRKPHYYEFGAQGSILIAIEEAETSSFTWSVDHGKNWEKTDLPDKAKIRPVALTTTPDSTSLKFLLIASQERKSELEFYAYAIDFTELLSNNKCRDKDYEFWPARVDAKGDPICVMGQKQSFKRRKPSADCIVPNIDYDDAEERRTRCDCTEQDYECDYNFIKEDGKCIPTGRIGTPKGACADGEKTFYGSSGYRLIPGNQCKGGIDLSKEVELDCNVTKAPTASGKIENTMTTFRGSAVVEYYYLERERSSRGEDETIIMRTTEPQAVWITHDHGKTWEQILKDEQILAIYPHQYVNDNVYLITPSKKVYYTEDRGHNWHSFDAPEVPNQNRIQVISFHPREKDWLIWTGGRDCKTGSCDPVAYVSTKGGDSWTLLLKSVRKCLFIYREDRIDSEKLVYCEQYTDSSLALISSHDWFERKETLKRDVINFATMAEYIVVALQDEDNKSLKVDTSIDGSSFADAQFPPDFNVPHQSAYTVLDSSTHAVFLHVTVNGKDGQEYGSIVKSNSNGTSYVLSASHVNRNMDGYVDFEKMQGIEGVAVINRVGNIDDVDSGSSKKLKTYITHNDGADWALLGRPVDPPKGDPFDCQGSTEKCSLHLHGYTERVDPRDTFSSASAIGLMIGTGNVGEYLGFKKEADTFITRNGGLTWNFVAEGNWMWEYGDQGSIIVIVKENEPTGYILYSLNEGEDWLKYEFSEKPMLITDISTVPSDTSLQFLLWGKDDKLATINLDFSSMTERSTQCTLVEDSEGDDDEGDYTLWTPKHPLSEEECLFGHMAEYHRKKTTADCFNGRGIPELHSIKKNCTCTRHDFECDYNYQRKPNGECELVAGQSKPDPAAVCKANPGLVEYNEVTGYRRIPLTTCQGGKQYDVTETKYPCPGHETEYKKKHGISGVGLFFAIVLPVAAAAGVGWWVWRNWDGSFGRIRLGDSMGSGGSGAFDREAPWIKYPVMAISGLVAVLAAVPMVVGSLWRIVNTRFGRSRASGGYARPYTSRDSFQRGRGTYAVVDPDEGELLGDESDDEV